MRTHIPQHPRGTELERPWDKWYNLSRTHSVNIYDFNVTIDPVSVAANTTAEQDFTVSGLGENDLILSLTKPTLTAGIGLAGSRVKSANTLSITFINATAGAIDPPSETYKLVVIRQ